VADVVGQELQLVTVPDLAGWQRHDARVGDQAMEAVAALRQRVDARAHRRRVGQLARQRHVTVAERRQRRGRAPLVARTPEDARAPVGQHPRRLQPEPRRDAGDEQVAAGEIQAGGDLHGGGRVAEAAGAAAALDQRDE
jgi:hypothetical protein